ncbi:MAG: hypothetical protein R3C10_10870 [Pirellulales bacterium]
MLHALEQFGIARGCQHGQGRAPHVGVVVTGQPEQPLLGIHAGQPR